MIAAVDDIVREIALEMRINVGSAQKRSTIEKSVRGGFLGVEQQK
jgi:hypothetical protein